jgi:hypothetical protein
MNNSSNTPLRNKKTTTTTLTKPSELITISEDTEKQYDFGHTTANTTATTATAGSTNTTATAGSTNTTSTTTKLASDIANIFSSSELDTDNGIINLLTKSKKIITESLTTIIKLHQRLSGLTKVIAKRIPNSLKWNAKLYNLTTTAQDEITNQLASEFTSLIEESQTKACQLLHKIFISNINGFITSCNQFLEDLTSKLYEHLRGGKTRNAKPNSISLRLDTNNNLAVHYAPMFSASTDINNLFTNTMLHLHEFINTQISIYNTQSTCDTLAIHEQSKIDSRIINDNPMQNPLINKVIKQISKNINIKQLNNKFQGTILFCNKKFGFIKCTKFPENIYFRSKTLPKNMRHTIKTKQTIQFESIISNAGKPLVVRIYPDNSNSKYDNNKSNNTKNNINKNYTRSNGAAISSSTPQQVRSHPPQSLPSPFAGQQPQSVGHPIHATYNYPAQPVPQFAVQQSQFVGQPIHATYSYPTQPIPQVGFPFPPSPYAYPPQQPPYPPIPPFYQPRWY